MRIFSMFHIILFSNLLARICVTIFTKMRTCIVLSYILAIYTSADFPLTFIFLVFLYSTLISPNISFVTSTPIWFISSMSSEKYFIINSSSIHLLCLIPNISRSIFSAHVASSSFNPCSYPRAQ